MIISISDIEISRGMSLPSNADSPGLAVTARTEGKRGTTRRRHKRSDANPILPHRRLDGNWNGGATTATAVTARAEGK